MLPAKKISSQGTLSEIFNDIFEKGLSYRMNLDGPAMNVIEDEKSYKIEIAAPGMCKNDISMHISRDGKLIIEMEKKCEEEKKECKDGKCNEKKFLRRELSYTKSRQALTLPEDTDWEKIEANVKHGILHIIIPKLLGEKASESKKIIEVK